MSEKVLVCKKFSEIEKAKLKETGADLLFMEAKEVSPEIIGRVDAVIGNLPANLLRFNQNLRWVQLTSSGADAYVTPGVLGAGTILTSATGAYGLGISEYMVAMLLVMMKKIPAYLKNQSNRLWKDEGQVVSPCGKRVLIVGTGNIGLEFAKRMRAFGCTLVGIRRRIGTCPEALDELHSIRELEQEVGRADIIALCLPGTEQTYHLFDESMLKACKTGSYLMNVGRGNVIDTKALSDPCVCANFSGIWLDVCETEPLSPEDALYTVPNLMITPHITGGFHLDETCNRIFEICRSNLDAWMHREELTHVVDRTSGYCK